MQVPSALTHCAAQLALRSILCRLVQGLLHYTRQLDGWWMLRILARTVNEATCLDAIVDYGSKAAFYEDATRPIPVDVIAGDPEIGASAPGHLQLQDRVSSGMEASAAECLISVSSLQRNIQDMNKGSSGNKDFGDCCMLRL